MKAVVPHIVEFTVIKKANDFEKIGEKLKLSHFGEYCPDNSLRGYNLIYLLDNPEYYRPTILRMKSGKKFYNYHIPLDRKRNYGDLTNLIQK